MVTQHSSEKSDKKSPHKRTKRKFLWKFLPKVVIPLVVLLIIVSGLSIFVIFKELPSPQKLNSPDSFAVSTQIFDRHGALLYEIYADENRTPIKLSDLPPHVYQASIAIEDQHFYNHFGFDLIGISRALKNIVLQKSLQGGSTITQQLVKTALLTRERTWERKAKEAVLTLATEALYSKDEILEMYLNHIPYGGTSWGIEAAAKAYFGKSAKELSIAEAALLAGLPQAPSRYSPFQSDTRLAKARQTEVLRRMKEDGYITVEQEAAANDEELKFALSRTDIKAPHFVFYVKDQLIQKYGEERVEQGGLRVKTTLDLQLQEVAQASLSAEIDTLEKLKVGNGAALITKPNTGEILAMIGSRDYFDATAEGKVNVTIEERQPGSSFKPINLAIAFELKKLTPASMLLDIPTCFNSAGSTKYCPKNYDNSFHGPVQQRFALGNSYNIPAVKVAALNSVETIIATGSAMGISTFRDSNQYGVSIGLGAAEVKMVDMAEAFGTLANQGVHVPLSSILEITDYQGNVVEKLDLESRQSTLQEMTQDEEIQEDNMLKRVLHRAPAYLVSHILLDNSARSGAFGSSSQLVIKDQVVSVKTGTTNNLKDNWTIGYTPEFLTAVWVGNNDGSPMSRVVSGVTGAAPIWNDIMSYVLKDQEPKWPEQPLSVTNKAVCSLSGLLPAEGSTCATRNEFFWEGTEPTERENMSKETWIDPTTGLPPKAGQKWEELQLVIERHTFLSDPFTQDYCLDCNRALTPEGKPISEQYVISADQDFSVQPTSSTLPIPTTTP